MNETGPLVSLFLPPGLPGAQGTNATGSATQVPQQNTPLLPSGTLLTGTIFGMDRQGNPVLRTENGDFVLKSEFHLRTGSEVTIRLESVGAGTRARILSVDGQPPGKTSHPLPGQDTVVNRSLTAGIASGDRAPETGATLRALLVSRSPELPAILRSLPPELQTPVGRVQQGAHVLIRLTATQPAIAPPTTQPLTPPLPTGTPTPAPTLPATTPATASASPTPAATPPTATPIAPTATPSTPATTSPSTTAPPTTAAPLTTPTTPSTPTPSAQPLTTTPSPASTATSAPTATPPAINYQPSTTTPASTAPNPLYAAYAKQNTTVPAASTPGPSPAATPPPAPHAGQIIATVLGTEGSGEIVLQTPLGTLKLLTPATSADAQLPPGSKLTLELLAIENPSTARINPLLAAAHAPRPLLALPELASSWPALQDFMHALSATDPAAAQRLIQQTLPKPGAAMATDLLFFLSALRGGDMSRWLDQKNLDRLEQAGRGDILARLTADFSSLRAASGDTGSPAWQAFFFPIYHDEELRQARLYVKKHKEEAPPGARHGKEDTRFILEIELSHLGDLQLDGFIKKKEGLTLFDLVIRSLMALDGHHQDEIMKIFLSASELTGFKGGLQFQHVPAFPVNPLDELLSGDHEAGGIIA